MKTDLIPLDEEDIFLYSMIMDVLDDLHVIAVIDCPFVWSESPGTWAYWKNEEAFDTWNDGTFLADLMALGGDWEN